jgi:hypothetical protein
MAKKSKKAAEETEFVSTEDHDNESPEEHQVNITLGNEDEDVYSKEGRKDLQEDDEIEVWEEGFAEGTGDDGGTE